MKKNHCTHCPYCTTFTYLSAHHHVPVWIAQLRTNPFIRNHLLLEQTWVSHVAKTSFHWERECVEHRPFVWFYNIHIYITYFSLKMIFFLWIKKRLLPHVFLMRLFPQLPSLNPINLYYHVLQASQKRPEKEIILEKHVIFNKWSHLIKQTKKIISHLLLLAFSYHIVGHHSHMTDEILYSFKLDRNFQIWHGMIVELYIRVLFLIILFDQYTIRHEGRERIQARDRGRIVVISRWFSLPILVDDLNKVVMINLVTLCS
jgi:hypothetical protein